MHWKFIHYLNSFWTISHFFWGRVLYFEVINLPVFSIFILLILRLIDLRIYPLHHHISWYLFTGKLRQEFYFKILILVIFRYFPSDFGELIISLSSLRFENHFRLYQFFTIFLSELYWLFSFISTPILSILLFWNLSLKIF